MDEFWSGRIFGTTMRQFLPGNIFLSRAAKKSLRYTQPRFTWLRSARVSKKKLEECKENWIVPSQEMNLWVLELEICENQSHSLKISRRDFDKILVVTAVKTLLKPSSKSLLFVKIQFFFFFWSETDFKIQITTPTFHFYFLVFTRWISSCSRTKLICFWRGWDLLQLNSEIPELSAQHNKLESLSKSNQIGRKRGKIRHWVVFVPASRAQLRAESMFIK